jgi:hypothetical protein
LARGVYAYILIGRRRLKNSEKYHFRISESFFEDDVHE